MKRTLLVFSFILTGLLRAEPLQTQPLAAPKEVSKAVQLAALQVVDFSVTNITDKAVAIKGYTVGCECTSLLSAGDTVQPHGTLNFRASIRKTTPAVEYVFIQDQYTNWYTVAIKLTNSATIHR